MQRVQQGTEFADSDQMKESEESEQENGFQAQSKVSKVGAWLATVQKKIIGWEITRRKSEARRVRDERQRQADERKVIPESTNKTLTEESYEDKIKAGSLR